MLEQICRLLCLCIRHAARSEIWSIGVGSQGHIEAGGICDGLLLQLTACCKASNTCVTLYRWPWLQSTLRRRECGQGE